MQPYDLLTKKYFPNNSSTIINLRIAIVNTEVRNVKHRIYSGLMSSVEHGGKSNKNTKKRKVEENKRKRTLTKKNVIS